MSQTCSKCSRVNPVEASYCYHDGVLLAGHVADGGPLGARSHPFPNPFVFSSGRPCRNFDELAVACHDDWKAARRLLQEGFFEKFFAGLGRADLARQAREAARFPDRDRGLDQLLGQLPTNVLTPPRLRVDPLDIHLGQLAVGQDRTFPLTLENQGLRLLYGAVTCEDCDWLALGEPPGAPEKLFQFGSEMVIPVCVKGNRLRASHKPAVGRLLVESNGGQATVTVRADVPVQPFPDGPLQGAISPRQVAEKAKAAPKEAACFFENGSVAAWYKKNGWTYPVHGPAASGLGAVQQFFEALGLTPAPKVTLSETAVILSGSAGSALRCTLEVRTDEKRPVYAYAVSNQPWLEVGRPRLSGRVASIPLVVPTVPDREGETLAAKLIVQANGNQRFVVPVTLHVGGSLFFDRGPPALSRTAETVPALAAAPTATVPVASVPVPSAAPASSAPAAPSEPGPGVGARLWPLVHLTPLLLLVLALAGTLVHDLLHKPPPVGIQKLYPDLIDSEPRLGVRFHDEKMRFGLMMLKERDPANPDKFKRLTSSEDGRNNNTRVRIDGFDYQFGQATVGHWPPDRKKYRLPGVVGWGSAFEFNEKVRVTQTVQLVPGEQTHVLDTCLVRYDIENLDTVPHKVGLRTLLDTQIGANDGVPFVIPGQPGLLDTMKDFRQKDIPDYIQALEYPDPAQPGTVAHLGLRLPEHEPIERMLIAAWPGNSEKGWEWEPEPMNTNSQNRDSSVTLWWAEQQMNPGETRRLGFTYGLNALSGDAQLRLTAGGDFRPGQEFTVTAYVQRAEPGQKVRLVLPTSMTLVGDQDPEQTLDKAADMAQVSWRIRAKAEGSFVLEATRAGNRATVPVRIRTGTIF